MDNLQFRYLLNVIKKFVVQSYKESKALAEKNTESNRFNLLRKMSQSRMYSVGKFDPCYNQPSQLVHYIISNIKNSPFTSRFARYMLEDKTTENYAYLREIMREFQDYVLKLGWCEGTLQSEFEQRAVQAGAFFDAMAKDFKKEDYNLRINDGKNQGDKITENGRFIRGTEVDLAGVKWIVTKKSDFHYEWDQKQQIAKRVEGDQIAGLGNLGGMFGGLFSGGSRRRLRRNTRRKSTKRRRRTHRKH